MESRISLTFDIQSRTVGTTTDSRVVNAIIEGNELVKRPGLLAQTYTGSTISSGQAQGIFSWNSGIVAAANGHVYKIDGTVVTEFTGSPYRGMSSLVPISYTQTINDNWLVFHDGSNIYCINKVNNTIISPISGSGVLSVNIVIGGGPYTSAPTVAFVDALVTITIASPAIVTQRVHGYVANQTIKFSTTGALPTGIVAGTTYYVIATGLTANAYEFSTSLGGAAVNTTGSQGGSQYITATATPATGHAVLYNNTVSSIIVDTMGTYAIGTTPLITITAPPKSQATITTSWGFNPANYLYYFTLALTGGGSGYVTAPIITSPVATVASNPATWATTISASGVVTSVSLVTQGYYVNSGNNAQATIAAPLPVTTTATANMNNTTAGPYVPGIAYLDGSVYVMTTGYAQPVLATITVSIASPAVVLWTAHGLMADTQVIFTTTGALPTGITAGTIYYVLSAGLTANAFEIALTIGGTPIVTSGTQSGVHTVSAVSQVPSVIYGSARNNPTSWSALNNIQATGESDQMMGFARHLNYLIAFGTSGTQFFYDAALPSPGSPLAENRSAFLEIGCANGYSIASAEQTIIWVGTSPTFGRSVYLLEGLSPVKLSTRFIEKTLNACDMSNRNNINVRSYCLKLAGHSLYVLTMKDLNITFICDLDEKKWYQWTSQSGDTGALASGTETFFSSTSFTGNVEYIGGLFLQDDSNGNIYKMSPDYYNDDVNKIYFRVVSPNEDNGSKKRKFYSSVEVVGDMGSGTVSIRKSDNDYQTWSTYRTVNLFDKRPILYQYGEARRRAWEVFSSDSVPIRLEAIEVDFKLSEQGPT